MNKKLVFIVASLLLSLTITSQAQDISDDKKASFVFDVDIVKLLENEHLKALGDQNITTMFDLQYTLIPNTELKDYKRIRGAFDLSFDFQELMNMGPGDQKMPFDFYIEIEFEEADSLLGFMDEMSGNSEVFEIDGNTYYGPPAGSGPNNLKVGVQGSKFVAGTDDYILRDDRNVLTEKVAEQFALLPETAAGRLAYDFDAASEFTNGFLEMFQEEFGFDPTVEMIFKSLASSVSEIKFGLAHADLEQDQLFNLKLVMGDEKSAKKVHGVADGLLFMAKVPINSAIPMIPYESKRGEDMLRDLTDQLKARLEGNTASLTINKPENFDLILREDYIPAANVYLADYHRRENFRNVAQACVNSYYRGNLLPFNKTDEVNWDESVSWRVRVLDSFYFGKVPVGYDIEQPVDSETNKKFADQMPTFFGTNGKTTRYRWVKSRIKSLDDITDPRHQTIMLIEMPEGQESAWMESGDDLSIIQVIKLVGSLEDGEKLMCMTYSQGEMMLDNTMKHTEIKALLTPTGGEKYHENASQDGVMILD